MQTGRRARITGAARLPTPRSWRAGDQCFAVPCGLRGLASRYSWRFGLAFGGLRPVSSTCSVSSGAVACFPGAGGRRRGSVLGGLSCAGILASCRAGKLNPGIGKIRTGNSQCPFHCGLAFCRRADRRTSSLSFCLGVPQSRPAHDPCPLRPGIVGQQHHMKHGRLIAVTPGMRGGRPRDSLGFGLRVGHRVLQHHVLRCRAPAQEEFMANAKVPFGKQQIQQVNFPGEADKK